MPAMRPIRRCSWLALALFACSAEPSEPLDAGEAPPPDASVDAGLTEDAGEVCSPSCAQRVCGDDGCGGSCGTCGDDEACEAGACVAVDTCANGRLDEGEVRVDCGGPCPPCGPRRCTIADSAYVPDGYDCVWNDEFGGPQGGGQGRRPLGTRSWTFQNLDVNGEAQNYTNRECTEPEHADDYNYCVEDGVLTILARDDGIDCTDGPDPDDQPDNPDCAPDWGEARGATGYTSGRIISKHKVEYRYGYIEFRARMPQHQLRTPESGLWPAIWLLGSNISEGPPPGDTPWPACGEVDIMEYRTPGNHMGWNAIWEGEAGGLESCAGSHPTCGPCEGGPCRGVLEEGDRWRWTGWGGFPHSTFHTYGLLWTAEVMEVFIDGEKMSTLRIGPEQTEFQQEMFLIVNLAVGGSLGGAIQVSDWSTATLEVDYLRWYQPL